MNDVNERPTRGVPRPTGRQRLGRAFLASTLLMRVAAVLVGGGVIAATDAAVDIPPAAAHSVAQGNTRVFLAPDDADRVLDRAQSGGGGIQAGDVLDYIIQFEPLENGATEGIGGYVTFYPPSYTEVLGAAVVNRTGNDYVDVPVGQSGSIENGPGSQGTQTWGAPFAGASQGSLAQLYGDTGIFYSTSPETAKYVGGADPDITPLGDNGYATNPTACGQLDNLGHCRAHNAWDYQMVNRFGDKKFVGRVVPSGRGNTPHRAGSPVGGPATHYNLDWRNQVGPWTRVAYPGSQTGTGVAPTTSPGPVAPTASTAWVPTNAGVTLDASNPDHDDITAVRWALGGITADSASTNDLRWVRVQLLFTGPPTGCPVDAEVFGGDAAYADGGKDNMWRYYVPVPAYGQSCLTIDKVGPAVVQPNGNITYTIRVGNITATPLTNVVVQDTLPAGTTYVSSSDSGSRSGSVVTWPTIASMPAQSVRTYTLTVRAPNTAGTSLLNVASADSTQTDPVISQWRTTTSATVADLRVVKTDVVDPVYAGANVTYNVAVTNNGPSSAAAVNLTDTLPAGTTFVSATPGTGTCSGTGPVSCSLGTIASGATVNVSVVVKTSSAGTITNSATATSTTPDPYPENNTDTEDTTVLAAPAPGIQVDKTVYRGHDAGAGCPGGENLVTEAGEAVTYCFTVTNTGNTTLAPVNLADPALGITGAQMTVLSGSLSSIPAGGTVRLYRQTTSSGDLLNTVTASGRPVDGGGTPIPGQSNVTDDDTASVDQVQSELMVDKSVYRGHDGGAGCSGTDLVVGEAGDPVTWCFTVTNTGDTTLAPITLDDADLGITQADMTVLSGSRSSLAPGASVRLFYEGTVAGDLVNSVEGSGTSPAGFQPTDTDGAAVDEVAPGIAVAKTVYRGHDSGAGCEGDELVRGLDGEGVTWCFTVTNTGDTTLAPVTLADPALGVDETDLTVLSGSLASLAPGASAFLYLEGSVAADLVNTAEVIGRPVSVSGLPLAGVGAVSDEDSAEVDEVAPAVSVDKTVYRGHDAGAGCAGAESVQGVNGDPVTWCFSVTNTGDTTLAPVGLDDADLGVTEGDLTVLSGDLAQLDPGETAVLYLEGAVDGDLTNTVTATGTPADGSGAALPGLAEVSAEDTAAVDEVGPSVSVDKTVYAGHDGGAGCAGVERVVGENGDPVTWCFSVTNTGNVPVTDVVLDDLDLGVTEADLTVLSGDLASLAPGDSAVLYLEGSVDGDLTNTVTVTGQTAVGEVSDEDSAEVDEVAPAVSVDKTVYRGHDAGAGCAGAESVQGVNGDPVTWCFSVTNTGDTTLAPVGLDDADLGVTEGDLTVLSGDLAQLDPGETAVLYLEGAVDGDLTNTVTATGTPADGSGAALPGLAEVSAEDTAAVDEVGPSVSVDKTVYAGHDAGAGCAGVERVVGENGDPVTWCFSVTNTGDTTLAPVSLDDADLGVTEADLTVLSGDLAQLDPGETAVLYLNGAIDGDLTNTAVVSGVPTDGGGTPLPGLDPVGDEDTARADERSPAVRVDKTVYAGHDAGAGCAGGEIAYGVNGAPVTWCFSVTNTGDTALTDVTLEDLDLGVTEGDLTVLSGDLASLAPGDSAVLYLAGSVDGDLDNTVTATAQSILGPVVDDDTAAVDEVAPSVTVDKTVYRVHDAGARCAGLETVHAIAGDEVTWCFSVTNTGDTTLAPVTLDDADLGITEADLTVLSGDLTSLAPGDTAVLYLNGFVDGDLTNTVDVAGTPADAGGTPLPGVDAVTDDDTAAVDEVAPGITLDKTAYRGHDGGAGCPGAEVAFGRQGSDVTWCFSVTNTGDTTLAPVTLDDADLGVTEADLTVLSGDLARLDPGDGMVLYLEGTIDGDLVNRATATGTPADDGGDPYPGLPDVSDEDTAAVQQVAPDVVVDKTVYAGHDGGAGCEAGETVVGRAGDAVTYCFAVTDTGDTDLIDGVLEDLDLGITQADMTRLSLVDVDYLDPGDTALYYYETTIAGDLTNRVSVTASPAGHVGTVGGIAPLPGVADVTDDDTAAVDEIAPAIAVDKTVYAGHDDGAGCAGDESLIGLAADPVTYCFTVTNTGDAALSAVAVSDPDLGITEADMVVASGSLDPLAAGDTVTLYYETELDGDLVNTATATGTPPAGPDVTATDEATVDELSPGLGLVKGVYAGHDDGAGCATSPAYLAVPVDAPVTWCFTVTNTGDVPVDDVTVDDADLGVDTDALSVADGDPSTLAPGASVTFYLEGTASADLENTATATATPPTGPPVTDDDTALLDTVDPSLTVAKTVYRGHDAGAGCAGGERVLDENGAPVTWCFVVTNTGDATLAPVTIDDADLGVTDSDLTLLSGALASLAPGDSATLYLDGAVDGDLVNTAVVEGTPVDAFGDPIPGADTVTDRDDAEVDEIDPALTVDKTVARGHGGSPCPGRERLAGLSGEAVTWCFAVTNTGDTDLDVTLDDPDLGVDESGLTVLSGSLVGLAPGDTVTLAYEGSIDGDLLNTVTATGTSPTGLVRTAEDAAEVDEQAPAVTLVKRVYAGHDGGASCGSAGDLITVTAGSEVTWCFTATDTGDSGLIDLTLDDADLGITTADLTVGAGSLSRLDPGESVELFYEGTAAGDLVNTAEVVADVVDRDGDPVTGPGASVSDTDSAAVDEVLPAITLDKTVYLGHDAGASCGGAEQAAGEAAQPVTWCFEVTNAGDVRLAPVTLTDADLGIDESDLAVVAGTLAGLDPGESVTLAYEGTVDGDLANTATATGIPRGASDEVVPGQDDGVSDTDGAEVVELVPDVALAKSVYLGHDAGAGCAGAGASVSGENGQPVTWCFLVTNTGDTDLSDVVLDDADLGVDQGDLEVLSGSLAALAPGSSVVLYLEGAVDGDLVNTATAVATPPFGYDVSDEDSAEVAELVPGYSLAKTVYRGHDDGASCEGVESVVARAGDPVTWCFLVSNTGETDLDVTVTDPDVGLDETITGLAPGEDRMLFVEGSVDGDLVNTASGTGVPPFGPPIPHEDIAEVDEVHPALTVDKTIYAGHDAGASCGGAESVTTLAGDPVTWCFLVTNTGDVELTDITLDDLPLLADETDLTVVSGSLASLPVDGTTVLYLEASASGDVANTVTASGVAPVGPQVSDEDTADLVVIDPSVTLDKTVYAGHDGGAGCDGTDLLTGLPGDDVTYCFTVTNASGQGPLTDVQVADLDLDDSGLSLVSGEVTPLADGASATFFLEAIIDGDLVNTGSVTATPLAGPEVSDEDTAEVDEVNAGIGVDKAVYLGHSDGAECATAGDSVADEAGGPVTWCFTVTNTGDATLTDVQVDDADLGIDQGDLNVLSGSLASLAPGESVVLYLEGRIDGDLTNTATATGTPPVGPEPTDEDTASVDELVPSYTLDKTVYRGHDDGASCAGRERVIAQAGDPVTWCIEVVNTGDTVLDIRVTDPDVGLDETVTGLAPGDRETLYVEGVVDGDLLNTVSGEGTPPHGPPVPEEDTAEVDEVHPGLVIDKTVYGGHDDGASCAGVESYGDEAGQPVTWCFTVTNTGDTDLTDLTVEDLDLGVDQSGLTLLSGSLSLLEAGDTVTLYLEGTLEADLTNTATATGTPPVGPDVSDEDTAEVEVLVPGYALAKTVYLGHDGGVSCEGGESVAARAGDPVTWCFLVTNTGETDLDVTVTDPDVGLDETVTDLAPGEDQMLFVEGSVDGDLVNVVSGVGTPPHGDPIPHEDTAEVEEIDPSIQVDKTVYLGHDGGASCAGVETVEAELGQAVTWCFAITNTGDVDLVDLDLSDPILGIDGGDVTLVNGSLASLAPDATIVAYYEGTVDGDIANTVTAGGVAPDDRHETDSDTAGVTVVGPQIGIAKTVVEGPTGNGDGTYTLTYRLRVANAGETRLDGVQVTDDLTDTFAGARSFRVDAVTSADLTVNAGYTGRPSGSIRLLSGEDSLDVFERGDIEVTVTVDPGRDLGPYENTAFASGTSPGGQNVDDHSDSGTGADPTNPNPDEPGDTGGTDDPVPVRFPPIDLTVVKTVGDVRVDGTSGIIDWRLVVTNDGPGDDPGPITVTDRLEERLSFVSATGEGWDCGAVGRLVTCVWDAPLAAGRSTTEIQLLTEVSVTSETRVTNAAHVSSTGAESRTDNNDDVAAVDAEVAGRGDSPLGTLPRTGLAVGTLVLLGLGLVLSGRLLMRRRPPSPA